MPEKYQIRNVTDRDLTFVRPVNLRMEPGEEKTVFLSDPQADAFRQNPGEVELVKAKAPEPAPEAARVKASYDSGPSSEAEKEEPPEPEGGGKKKGRR